MEAVSKVESDSRSCHDSGCPAFYLPHPNPLPLGEGANWEALYDPLSLWERDRVRAHSCQHSAYSMGFETAYMPCPYGP